MDAYTAFNFIRQGSRYEVYSVNVFLIAFTLIENRIQRVIYIAVELVEVLLGNPSEAVFLIMEVQQAVNIEFQSLEGLDAVHGSLAFLALRYELCLPVLQIRQVLFRFS